MQVPSMLQGDSLARLLQGAAAGCAITLAVGFGWGGWQLHSKSQKLAQETASAAVVAVLAPICADKFQNAADAPATLIKLKATERWKQDTFVADGGWATFPGSKSANRSVAEACAKMLSELK